MQAHITGNLTADPELRTTPAGKRKARFTVAVDDRYRTAAGDWSTRPTLFFNVEAWDDAARSVAALRCGAPVVVVGDWRASEWTAKNGEKRTAQYVLATAIGHDVGRAEARATARARKAQTQPMPEPGPSSPQPDGSAATPDDFFGDD